MPLTESKIHARTILLLYSADGTAYSTVAALTENSLDNTNDSIEANTKDGNSVEYGDIFKAKVSFKGETVNSVGIAVKTSTAELYALFTGKINGYWKIGKSSPVTGDVVWSFRGYVNVININDPDGQLETFSGNITVNNPPVTFTRTP